MKELYLYSPIYDSTAQELVSGLQDAGNDADVNIRMLTGGGNVFAGWAIITKMQERTGKTTITIDGAVMSMGAVIPLFADYVIAADVATIMFHRADMYVDNDEDQKRLDGFNKTLRQKIEDKIDLTKLPASKATTMDELFDPKQRKDLYLTAKEARDIGLVDKVVKVAPKELEAVTNKWMQMAATAGNPTPTSENQNLKNMTLEKLKAEFPAVYNAIIALGHTEGVAAEKERVEACLVFAEIDPAGVKAAIESGKPLCAKQMAEFGLKAMSATRLKEIKKDAAGNIVTEEVTDAVKTEKEKNTAAFLAEAKNELKLK